MLRMVVVIEICWLGLKGGCVEKCAIEWLLAEPGRFQD